MSSSNRYAAKIFSEHPIASWPLDDNVYYLSLIDNNERDFSDSVYWTTTNCTIEEMSSLFFEDSPFASDAAYYKVNGDSAELGTTGGTIGIISDFEILKSDCVSGTDGVSINFYLYQDSVFASSYEWGVEFYDDDLEETIRIANQLNAKIDSDWIRFQNTFKLSEINANSFKIFIDINVNPEGVENEYNFILNALSVGQFSEAFSSESLGSFKETLPQTLDLGESFYGIKAEQYGPLSDYAYYVIENNNLLAKADAFPIVFGSKNSISLYPPQNNSPSFVIPNKDLFSENGKYKSYTVEFWMRIKPNTKEDRKIFGPINSNDGLYVSEGFITLVIGKNFQSFNVSEWYRPMLVHITYSSINAKLFINGEEVISILLDSAFSFSDDKWLGFYCYSDINLFEIDCVSIFPYLIPLQVAKRRFVWGQGVGSQEKIDFSFNGTPTAISFPNANYSSNILYPDKERWNGAYYNNLISTSTSISVPQYTLPEIFLGGRSLDLWYSANQIVNDLEYSPSLNNPKFITFRPGLNEAGDEWDRFGADWVEKSYLTFSSKNFTNNSISSFYGIFKAKDDLSYSRPLIHILNVDTNKKFEINIENFEVTYVFDDNIIYTKDFSEEEYVAVGLDMSTISKTYNLSNFFGTPQSLKFFIGGSPDTNDIQYETFEGEIYRITFADSSNKQKIETYFNENGIINTQDYDALLKNYSTYSLAPINRYDNFFLDISVSSEWEQYYPLSFFAKYVYASDLSLEYVLDFLQFNIGYPSYLNITQDEENNILIDEEDSSLRIFATFQLISEGANEPIDSFTYTKQLSNNMVIDASLENTQEDPYKAYKTKFKIIDNTIIYPPKNIEFDQLALVLHFSINQEGIISKPLSVRDMEISSKALNFSQPNAIGTKFLNNIYPYTKSGIYFNYKNKSPFLINKKNTPYLYLTEKNGVKVLRNNDENREYGIIVPVNASSAQGYFAAGIQLFVKYDSIDELQNGSPLFEINAKEQRIQFVVDTNHPDNRYKIVAKNKNTGEIYDRVNFYQNGASVNNPILDKNKWSCIAVFFDVDNKLDFSEQSGSINLFAGCSFDNISIYQSNGLNEVSSITYKKWQQILFNEEEEVLDWGYWYDQNGALIDKNRWEDILASSKVDRYLLGAPSIYSAYVGTNVNYVDDEDGIDILDDDFIVFSNILWSNIVDKPV